MTDKVVQCKTNWSSVHGIVPSVITEEYYPELSSDILGNNVIVVGRGKDKKENKEILNVIKMWLDEKR